MNIFKNIYGKLSIFYVLIACLMVYLAFQYESKLRNLDDFYNTEEFAPNAQSNGAVPHAVGAEASLP